MEMYGQPVPLFAREKLKDVFEELAASIPRRVDGLSEAQFLAATDEAVVDHVLEPLATEPLTIYEDQMEMETAEAMVDITGEPGRDTRGGTLVHIKGIKVDVMIPFSGGVGLWHLMPNKCPPKHPSGYPDPASGSEGILHIIEEQPNDAPMERLKAEIEGKLKLIRLFIDFQAGQLRQINQEFADRIRAAVQSRRIRLNLHQTVPGILGIPLKRKNGAPNFAPIEIKRKLVRPLPIVTQRNVAAEPGIAEADYQHILSVIRHEGRTFETTPKTYRIHDEEELRDIMLAHLNGHYEGNASGEAFRKTGKTDIKIEDGNRSAFVSEYKIWRGPKELTAAISQLLSYLTWRDGKAALVIFNKDNAKFTEVLAKTPDILKAHPNFKQYLGSCENGEWRVKLFCADDTERYITVTVFVFNLYVPPGK